MLILYGASSLRVASDEAIYTILRLLRASPSQ